MYVLLITWLSSVIARGALDGFDPGYSILRGTKMNKLASIKAFLLRVRYDEEGVTAVEYGLIAALVAVVIATAVGDLGTNLGNEFTNIAAKFPAKSG